MRMILTLLSPTKTLKEHSRQFFGKGGDLLLKSATELLVQRCQQLSKAEIKSLMSVSDKLATLNYERFQGFGEATEYEAGFLFDGPSFQMLNVEDFDEPELNRLQSSLCILSGLYGLLRPLDRMKPYRLEMSTKLDVDGCPNLYKFWAKHDLTSQLATLAKENEASIILNCASLEYSKVVDFKALEENHDFKVVNCIFRGPNNGALASVFGKQARGLMARFVAKTGATSVEDLKAFDGKDGEYKFAPKLSSDKKLVFERIGVEDWNDPANIELSRTLRAKQLNLKRKKPQKSSSSSGHKPSENKKSKSTPAGTRRSPRLHDQ